MLTLVFVILPIVDAWSHESHKIVARVAGDMLSRKAGRFVRMHLEETIPDTNMNRATYALMRSSSWADFVDSDYEWSSELHFSHTPYRDCQEFVLERDCGFDRSGRCVVTAIANFTARAADFSLRAADRTEALKFLVHLVADAHSPMHVGFAKDFGGNSIDVLLPDGKETTLHEVWDSEIFGALDSRWLDIAHDLIDVTEERDFDLRIPDLAVDGSLDFAARIVSETSTKVTCERGYKLDSSWIVSGHRLTPEYIEASKDVLLEQLTKSAVRLAQVIEAVANEYFRAEKERDAALVAAPVSRISSSNIFNLLDIDMDLEDHVFEVADAAPVVPLEEEREDPKDAAGTTAVPRAKIKSSPKQKKAKAKQSKASARCDDASLLGTDIDRLVILKRAGRYVITYRELVTSDAFYPARFVLGSVRFRRDTAAVLVMFDVEIFGSVKDISREFVDAMFRRIGGLAPAEARTGSGGCASVEFQSGYMNVSPVAREHMADKAKTGVRPYGRIPVGTTAGASVRDMIVARKTDAELGGRSHLDETRERIQAQSRQIIQIPLQQVMVITRLDWLNDNMRFVFNEVRTMDPERPETGATIAFIDARLIDEVPDSPLLSLIQSTMDGRVGEVKVSIMLARKSRALQAMFFFADYISNGMKVADEVPVLATIESINRVVRPDRPEMSSYEFVFRNESQFARLSTAKAAGSRNVVTAHRK